MEEFQVKILASDHPFYEGKCYSLVIPTLRGMYGIHAHHSNMITAIIPGTLQYQIVPGCRWYTLSLSISSAANVTPSPEHRNAVRRAVPCAQRHTTPMASARFMDA